MNNFISQVTNSTSKHIMFTGTLNDEILIIEKGMIPSHVSQLDMRNVRARFLPGAIGPNLIALFVKDIEEGSIFPDNLIVFLWEYTERFHLPNKNFFIPYYSHPNIYLKVRKARKSFGLYTIGIEPLNVDIDDYDREFECVFNLFSGKQKVSTYSPRYTPIDNKASEMQILVNDVSEKITNILTQFVTSINSISNTKQ